MPNSPNISHKRRFKYKVSNQHYIDERKYTCKCGEVFYDFNMILDHIRPYAKKVYKR